MSERCCDCRRVIRPNETAYLIDEQVCCGQCHLKRELGLAGATFCARCHRLIPGHETAYVEDAELIVCGACTPQVPHEKARQIGGEWMSLDEDEPRPRDEQRPRTTDSGHPLLHLLRMEQD